MRLAKGAISYTFHKMYKRLTWMWVCMVETPLQDLRNGTLQLTLKKDCSMKAGLARNDPCNVGPCKTAILLLA